MKKQLFINFDADTIPWDKKDPRYSSFWENEKSKVERGVNIDGFQISGWLYWHICHWKIQTDVKTEWGEIVPEMITPYLRDNEIILNAALLKAEEERKGLCIMGLRQMAKTTMESSYSGRAGVLFKGSQNLLMGTNKDDLNNITQYIDFGLLNCSPYFRIPRITRDWGSERVLLGVKTKGGDNIVHSTFVIRNTGGGVKTEKGAGVSNLKSNIWDEIGKDDFLSSFIATKPAMLSKFGWRTIPILVGTGGSVEKGKDAKALFFNPASHNILEFDQPDGRKIGLFMAGWLRQDCKYKTSLGSYLLEQGYLTDIPKDSELWETSIEVSDKDRAVQTILKEIKELESSDNREDALKWRMYYPLDPDDIFLSTKNNSFPIEACLARQEWLKHHYEPNYVDFYRGINNEVKWKESFLKPINKFPVSANDDKHAPVVIYQFPDSTLPRGTYVMGCDPYNYNESSDRVNSLGSFHIIKRTTDPLGEYQYSIVCSYAGRPDTVEEFYEICYNAAEFYNCYILPEHNKNFEDFFIQKGKGFWLWDSPKIATDINPNSKTGATKGLTPSAINQKFYMNLMVRYTKTEVPFTEGEVKRIELGVNRINDIMLLQEMIEYRAKDSQSAGVHDINCDRIISFGHALVLANHLDIYMPVQEIPEETKKDNTERIININLFGNRLTNKKTPPNPFGTAPTRIPKKPFNW